MLSHESVCEVTASNMGCGRDAVGRVKDWGPGGPQFKSAHWPKLFFSGQNQSWPPGSSL